MTSLAQRARSTAIFLSLTRMIHAIASRLPQFVINEKLNLAGSTLTVKVSLRPDCMLHVADSFGSDASIGNSILELKPRRDQRTPAPAPRFTPELFG
jgi:hypothetical protein